MSKVVISDSACLIALSKIGRLNILQALFSQIIIPEAVYQEVVADGKNRPGSAAVSQAEWIQRETAKDEIAVNALRINLGAGESEAIILAKEKKADFVIIDDRDARLTASEMGLPVIGTAGIIVKAAQKGLVENKKYIFDELRSIGFYLPKHL